MKRFYKFLMPLVAIVAMALPVNVMAQDSCTVKIIGEDSFGDGWNGGSLAIMQGTTQVATFTLSSGDDLDSITVTVADAPVSFVWTSGSYDSEVSFGIYHSSGVLLYSVSTPTAGTVFSLSSPCSGCFAPGSVRADSLGSDAAHITWVGNATSYGYLWGTAADMIAGSGTPGTTSDSYLELTGLTSGTGYTVMVWSDCGTETSDTVTISFATIGDAVSVFPYNTGFEATDDMAWSFINDGTNKWFIGAGAAHTGTNGLYVSNDNGTTNAYTNSAIQISYAYRVLNITEGGQYAIGFDWKCNGESNYDYLRAWLAPASAVSSLTAGQLPDGTTSPYNYTNTTPAGWIDLGGKMNLQTSWQTATATPTLSANSYILVFMWANDGSSGTNPPIAIDNVDFHLLSCYTPVNVAVSNLTPNSFDLSWGAGNNETEWVINFNDSTLITGLTDSSYSFTALGNNTTYTVSVAAVCGAGDTSFYYGPITVVTPCEYFDSLPFFMDFESSSTGSYTSYDFAPCWTLTTDATQYPYVYVSSSSSYNHTPGGTKGVYWYRTTTTGTYGTYQTIVLPGFDPTNLSANQMQLSFWAKASSTSYHPLFTVGVMTNPNDINSFVTMDTVHVEGTAWTYYEVNLNNYTGNGNFVAIRSHINSSWYAYIDDIKLDLLPSCPRPTNLHAEYVSTDSIVLAWTPGNEETTWLVSNGIDSIEVNDTTYTFENLSASSLYHCSVRALCADEDSSIVTNLDVRTACGLISTLPFVEDFENQNTTSSSSPAFIPCWGKSTNATSYYYPYVSNSTTYNHTDGGSMGIYWYYTTSSGYGTYHAIVLPGLDTTVYPVNNTMLTFWAKPSSTTYYPVFIVGVMSDPTADSTFQAVDTIALPNSTNWAKYTVMFDGFTGTGNYIAIRDKESTTYWYAYVDDITLDEIPACPPVENLAVNAGVTSAIVTWENITAMAGAVVEYHDAASTTWNTVTVTGQNYAVLTGLTPETNYTVRVANVCPDVNSNYRTAEFATSAFPCSVFDSTSLINVTIGSGSTTNSYIPSYSLYNYGLTQQFFKGSEIGGSGVITSITLYPSAIAQQRTYEIYMAQTSDSAASSFVMNPSGLTCVYNGGHIDLVAGQPVTFNLTTPFNYNSASNLLVIFRDLTGSYVSGNAWLGDNAWNNASCYIYQDGGAYTPGSTSGGTASNFRNKITFFGGACQQASTCAAPLPIVANIGTTTAEVAWAPGNTETSWNLYYRTLNDANFTFAGTSTTTTYTFTGLASGTPHEFMVVPVCADSIPGTVRGTTECATLTLPYTETFNGWGSGTGVLPNCWLHTGSYSSYPYISTSYNMTGSTGGSLYMYHSGTGSEYSSRLFMPAIDTNVIQANQTQLVFYSYYNSTSYFAPAFEVGVMSDPDDASTFVPVDTVYHTAGMNTWQVHEASLANYTGNGAYVGFHTIYAPDGSGSTYTYPYVDNMTLEMIPTCPRPDSLTATNATTTTVDLGWHERGSAISWVIEYGPRGFQLGTGTTVTASSNPFTLTGLPAAYQGEYYVKSVCGAGDTGEYSRQSCAFGTSQVPATLPYNYDFENATEWANWQTSTNHATADWYRGTDVADSGSYSMYVANSDSGYFNYSFSAVVNAAAYRDIDFGPVDSSYTISFRARAGGTTTNSYDGLGVYLVDPSIATVPSNNNITSPWGNVNDLYWIASVRLDTTWQTYTASFDTIHGIHRVAFFWFNQNTGASYTNIPQAAAVDNIHIDYSSCPRPVALEAVPSTTSALLTWVGPASATYEITYRKVGDTVNSTIIANTNNFTLTGLVSPAEYRVWVRKLCGADTSLYSDGVAFTTLCSPINLPYVENFNSTPANPYSTAGSLPFCWEGYSNGTSDAYFPHVVGSGSYWYSNDNTNALTLTSGSATYGDTKIVALPILNADLSTCMMSFYYRMESTSYGDLEVGYFTGYDLENDFVPVDTMPRTSTITLDSVSFAGIPSTALRLGFRWTHNASFYSVGIDNITVTGTGSVMCDAPAIDTAYAGETEVTLQWTGSAASYEVAAMEGTWIEPIAGEPAVGNTATITGLTPATTYTVGVRGVCGEGRYSDWTVTTITTEAHPCYAPTAVTATNPTFDGATIAWTVGEEGQSNFEIHITAAGVDTLVATTSNPVTVTGLPAATAYTVTVRAVCGEGDNSEWSAPATFSTATCQMVEGVRASATTATTATITWTANGSSSYEVAYGITGTSRENCTRLTANTNSITINGLAEATAYDVYVRSVCAAGVTSDWSDVVTFETQDVAIDDVDNASISLYPNPASSTVTLTGIEGDATVTVVDMNGRESGKWKVESGKLTIDVTGYAQGAYFVRITGDRVNAIRKLIVR